MIQTFAPSSLDIGNSAAGDRNALWATVIAAVLGVVIVFGVGFAGADVLHNAAHDARHSINMPCH